jgi:multidrug efflux pump subunit AcrB
MSKIVEKFIKFRHIVVIILVFFIFAGIGAYFAIPKQENPDTNLPAALITTIYPGATTMEVEEFVSKKIENKLYELPNIDMLKSFSFNSASIVIVMFEVDADPKVSLDLVNQALEEVKVDLPPLAYDPQIDTDLADVPQFILSLSNPNLELSDLALYGEGIADQLLPLSGVIRVDVLGKGTKQVEIDVNIDDLYLYKISIENIVQLLQAQNLTIPSGSIDYEDGKINVQTPATFQSLEDIENIVISGSQEQIGFVYLKDVAKISIQTNFERYFKHNDDSAIFVVGYFNPNENAVAIGKQVDQKLTQIKNQLPADITFDEMVLSYRDIEHSVNSFIRDLFFSIGLIVFVVMIGVQLQNAIIVSISLPLSIFATFIVMLLLKIEFHFISIAALIISLGILVDNSIVVTEAIQYRLNEDYPIMEAVFIAIKETARPVFTSTLTTIVTFGILFFIPGVIGKTVATIPIVVITALSASYFVSLFIVPVLATYLLKKEDTSKQKTSRRTFTKRSFEKALDFGLANPKKALLLASVILLASVALFSQLGMSFFPNSDKEMLYINVQAEQMNIDVTNDVMQEISEVLKQFEQVKEIYSAAGGGLPKFFITTPLMTPSEDQGQILLKIDRKGQYRSNEELGYAIQQALDQRLINAKAEVKYLEYSMPTDARIVFKVSGEDLEAMVDVATRIEELLEAQAGTFYVRNDFVANQYEYKVNIDNDFLATTGILKYDVVKQINTALMGAQASSLIIDHHELDIVVKADINTVEDLYRLPIKSSTTDSYLQLRQIADVDLVLSLPSIARQDRLRTITVLSDVHPGYVAAFIENNVLKQLKADGIDHHVTVKTEGELKNILDLVQNLGISALVAIVIIYMILLVQFVKFKKPFIILASIPLSLTGVFLGLYLFQVDIQAMALLGAVSLIGIVVNNGILLLEVVEEHLKDGYSLNAAIRHSVDVRYRPIILATITTEIGLIPLIIAKDPMSAPMALVLFFGLASSTILTLVIVPVLVSLLYDEGKAKKISKAVEV